MHKDNSSTRGRTTDELVAALAAECGVVGAALAAEGARRRSAERMLRVVNPVAAILVFATMVPAIAGYVGRPGVAVVVAFAVVVLLLDTVMPVFGGSDNPERFEDFARYICRYGSWLQEALEDTAISSDVRSERLKAMRSLAHENLNDVKLRWPNLYDAAISRSSQRLPG